MLPKPIISSFPENVACFILGFPSLGLLSAAARGGVTGCCQERGIADVDQARPIEAVEGGTQRRAISAQLADFDPVALVHVFRKQERAFHPVGGVACRPEQPETPQVRRSRITRRRGSGARGSGSRARPRPTGCRKHRR